MQALMSMQVSGLMYNQSGISWKASTEQAETQIVNLQSTHVSIIK